MLTADILKMCELIKEFTEWLPRPYTVSEEREVFFNSDAFPWPLGRQGQLSPGGATYD